jgi:sporulation protein YlmC with PRC-barrel domain
MVRNFRAQDQGKKVVTADGDEVGTIQEVRDERAFVKPDQGLSTGIRQGLGWGEDEDTYELRKANVEKISDIEVQLKHNL